MAQYAILIYAHDSAHRLDATPEDTATSDAHAEELTSSGALVMAYALTPRDMATSIAPTRSRRPVHRIQRGHRRVLRDRGAGPGRGHRHRQDQPVVRTAAA